MGGHRFTYLCHDDLKLRKLDRFIVCSKICSFHPNVTVTALPRETSDHCPVLLSTSSFDFGPIPFRFFNPWMDMDGFSSIVANACLHFKGFSTTDCLLVAKLKHLKKKIKEWRVATYPKKVEGIKLLKNKVDSSDHIAETRVQTGFEKVERRDIFKKIIELEKLISLDLKKKSRIHWAIDGDENTSFFHGWVSNKNRKNNITGFILNQISTMRTNI